MRRVGLVAASAGGAALAAGTRLVAAVRRAPRPLHPRGAVVTGRLHRHGLHPAVGVWWLDETGVDEVVVRRSRSAGLPRGMPDVHGLSVRIPVAGGGFGDLLFASTGLGPLTRFLLTVSPSPYSRPQTTLLPYRTAVGPLLLSAVPEGEGRYGLGFASVSGDWRSFGTLELSAVEGPDPVVSFDPVLNTVPGLDHYDWVVAMREPSYASARRSRSAS